MDPMVIPLMALLIPIIVAPTALGLKLARTVREMEHAERMKALELGRTLPQDEPWLSPAKICVMIAVGVPTVAMAFAYLTTESVGFKDEVWLTAMSVSVSGVISGSILGAKHFSQRAAAAAASHPKPHVDYDAFDVVGTRG